MFSNSILAERLGIVCNLQGVKRAGRQKEREDKHLEFCSLASGSSGNSYVVRHGDTVLLVDCGISGKKIFSGLKEHGMEPTEVSGVLITHEHSDHTKSIKVVLKKSQALAYMNIGTWQCLSDKVPEEKQILIGSREEFQIGDITIRPFVVSHDATEPLGYSFIAGGRQLSILTDTGIVTDSIERAVRDADLLVVEANHDVNVLQMSSYPYSLKRRILGNKGHLSNEAAATCIMKVYQSNDKPRQILLAHLSHQNNTPEMARITVCNMLEEAGIVPGGDIYLDVITRDAVSSMYQV